MKSNQGIHLGFLGSFWLNASFQFKKLKIKCDSTMFEYTSYCHDFNMYVVLYSHSVQFDLSKV